MKKIPIIIISGPPSAGKSTLAKKLSERYRFPIVSCDSIKELLFDAFHCNNLALYKMSRAASYNLMYSIIELFLQCKQPFIIDSVLSSREIKKKLSRIHQNYNFKCLHINLAASGKILWERYQKRSASGLRHPGYLDNLRKKQLEKRILKGYSRPPNIKGKIIEIDTTDFKKINYNKLFTEINKFLNKKFSILSFLSSRYH